VTSGPHASQRPLAELLRDLSHQAYTLVRQEMALARTEVSEQASAMMNDALWIGAGVLLIHMALGALVAAIVLALAAAGMPLPAAAAVVAVVLLAIGAFVVQSRVSAIRRRRAVPSRAISELKETGQWLRNQTS
jgi:uncharacterized membrane protein YqjE